MSLHSILEAIRGALDRQLRWRWPAPANDPAVVLTNLVDIDGTPNDDARNRIVMLMVNLRNETMVSSYQPYAQVPSGQYANVAAPLYLDPYLLFYAFFEGKRYPEGLERLDATISYFQQNPVFTRSSLPALQDVSDKVALEFANLDPTDLNHLLGAVGAKFLPSAFYKLRMVAFDDRQARAFAERVSGLETPERMRDGVATEEAGVAGDPDISYVDDEGDQGGR